MAEAMAAATQAAATSLRGPIVENMRLAGLMVRGGGGGYTSPGSHEVSYACCIMQDDWNESSVRAAAAALSRTLLLHRPM
jgi:hypothetical protein